jgi:hypothetical protein
MTIEQAIAQIRDAIKKYLGRDATDAEILQQHLSGGRHYQQANVDAAIGTIISSEEARNFKHAEEQKAATDPAQSDPFEGRPQAGDFSRTEGFAANNWGSMNSIKYRAGEILARYPPTPEGLKQALQDPDFIKLFPNAKLVGHDTIDFGGQLSDFDRGVGVGRVDVGRAFDPTNNTGGAWVWQDQANTSGSMGGASTNWRYRGLPSTPAPSLGGPPDSPGVPNFAPPPGSENPAFGPDNTPAPTQDVLMRDFVAPPGYQPQPGDVSMLDLARQRQSRIGLTGY